MDVTDEEASQAAVQIALDAFGQLDVLVNNAGYGDTRPFEQVPSEDFRRLVDTCFFGVVNLSRAAIPIMRRQRSGHNRPSMLPEYQESVGKMMEQLEGYWGNEPGDPAKVAEIVLRLADAETLPAHLLLGGDSVKMIRQIEAARMAEAERWSAVSDWIDFAAKGQLPALPTS